MSNDSPVTIGALAERVGVSASTLRAWEHRYGLLNPPRSEGGYRYYSADDEARVRRLLRLRGQGVPLAEAAAQVAETRVDCTTAAAAIVTRLLSSVQALDEQGFDEAWREALEFSVSDLVTCVALPLMRRVGEEWASGTLAVSHEHFASHEVRGRLFSLRPPRPVVSGPRAIIACPPKERHDLGALGFAVLLSHHGWQVRFLGAETPLPTLLLAARQFSPQLVVLSSTRSAAFEGRLKVLCRLAATWPLGLGGAGATEEVLRHIPQAILLARNPNAALVQAELLLDSAAPA